MKRYISLALTVLTTATISNSAVLKGFSNSFSTQSVGASNTGCATWEECLSGSDDNSGGNNSIGNDNITGTTTPRGIKSRLYYLKYPIAGIEKHPYFKIGNFNFSYIHSYNAMSYIRTIIENNINKLPIKMTNLYTGERLNIKFSDAVGFLLKNDDGSYSFISSGITTKRSSSDYSYTYFYTANRTILDKDWNIKNRKNKETKVFKSMYYYSDILGRSIKEYNQRDGSFTVYNFLKEGDLCKYDIKKDTSGIYDISNPSCYSIRFPNSYDYPSLIDIYHSKGWTGTVFYFADAKGRVVRYDTSSNVASYALIENKTDTVVPLELQPIQYPPVYNNEDKVAKVATNVDKSFFIAGGKKYLVDPATGGLKEDGVVYSFPPAIFSKAKNVELNQLEKGDMKVIQPVSASNGYCDYEIKYKASDGKIYSYTFKSLFYDTGTNKCYTLDSIRGYSPSIVVGDKVYKSGKIEFREMSSGLFFIGYSTKENGKYVFYMVGFVGSNSSAHIDLEGKILFKSAKDGKYYLLLNDNLVLELDGVNDSTEFFDEVIIK